MSLTREGQSWVIQTGEQLVRFTRLIAEQLKAGALKIDVRQWVPPKTRRQRSYLHALIRDLAEQQRVDETELKDDLKVEFGVVTVAPSLVTGDRVAKMVSTERYDRDQMTAFIKSIQSWAASKGLTWIEPEDHETAEALLHARPRDVLANPIEEPATPVAHEAPKRATARPTKPRKPPEPY